MIVRRTSPSPRDGDETAFVDLAIAFFAAVLVVFVFVTFNTDVDPEPEPTETMGQLEELVEIHPPGWAAVIERSSFAILHGGVIFILDMDRLAAGMIDRAAAIDTDAAYTMHVPGRDASPVSFVLRVFLTLPDLPAPWLREMRRIDDPGGCPDGLRPLITLMATPDSGDLTDLLRWLGSCGYKLRLERLAPPDADGLVEFALQLGPGVYQAEGVFR